MDKLIFISTISSILKQDGFRKHGNYWYKESDGFTFCINVQGSQWDKSDYYVEIGISYSTGSRKNPTLWQWFCRHRCQGKNGDVNIHPSEFTASLSDMMGQVQTKLDIETFLSKKKAQKIVAQYWF